LLGNVNQKSKINIEEIIMYTLIVEPYYNTFTQCYQNIITINMLPKGPLRALVRRIQFNKLGPNYNYSQCSNPRKCGLALVARDSVCCRTGTRVGKWGDSWMTPDAIPDLFSFLSANGYVIDTSITNMMSLNDIKMNNNQKILCFVSYKKSK